MYAFPICTVADRAVAGSFALRWSAWRFSVIFIVYWYLLKLLGSRGPFAAAMRRMVVYAALGIIVAGGW